MPTYIRIFYNRSFISCVVWAQVKQCFSVHSITDNPAQPMGNDERLLTANYKV